MKKISRKRIPIVGKQIGRTEGRVEWISEGRIEGSKYQQNKSVKHN